MDPTQLLTEVVKQTRSELILFFVILAVILIAVLVPVVKLIVTRSQNKFAGQLTLATQKQQDEAEETKRDQYIQREAKIIEVIVGNTEANTKLVTVLEGVKQTLDTNHQRCEQCKMEQIQRLASVDQKQNQTLQLLQAQSIARLPRRQVAKAKEE